jgi:hypothetical protein
MQGTRSEPADRREQDRLSTSRALHTHNAHNHAHTPQNYSALHQRSGEILLKMGRGLGGFILFVPKKS